MYKKRNMQMNQEQRATEFAVFCIENTANRLQCTGFEVFQELQRTDGIKNTYRYLSKKMYRLHNMSDAYFVDEIMLELQRKQQ